MFAKKEKRFIFEGRHSASDKLVNGEVSAFTEEEARKKLAKRGIRPLQITRVKTSSKRKITQEDITVFTRQLSTMIKAGLPLMQAFEIVARGHGNPSMTEMLMEIRGEVEQGSSLSRAFSEPPKIFRPLLLQSGCGGRNGRRIGKPAGQIGNLQRKNPGHPQKGKNRTDLSGIRHRRRHRFGIRDDDFRTARL